MDPIVRSTRLLKSVHGQGALISAWAVGTTPFDGMLHLCELPYSHVSIVVQSARDLPIVKFEHRGRNSMRSLTEYHKCHAQDQSPKEKKMGFEDFAPLFTVRFVCNVKSRDDAYNPGID